MLDTIRTFETPEGAELELRVAGVGARALAWMIDSTILVLLLLGVALVIFAAIFNVGSRSTAEYSTGLHMLIVFFLWWFYDVYFEVFRNGATPGKKFMGLRVVHDDGTPVGWGASIVRNLLRSVDFMPFLYFFGMTSLLLNKDFKRLGDLSAGTLVIYTEPTQSHQPTLPETTPVAPPVWLSQEEQRSLIELAERSRHLSTDRVAELADLLQPLTGKKGRDSAARLFGYANWMLGRR